MPHALLSVRTVSPQDVVSGLQLVPVLRLPARPTPFVPLSPVQRLEELVKFAAAYAPSATRPQLQDCLHSCSDGLAQAMWMVIQRYSRAPSLPALTNGTTDDAVTPNAGASPNVVSESDDTSVSPSLSTSTDSSSSNSKRRRVGEVDGTPVYVVSESDGDSNTPTNSDDESDAEWEFHSAAPGYAESQMLMQLQQRFPSLTAEECFQALTDGGWDLELATDRLQAELHQYQMLAYLQGKFPDVTREQCSQVLSSCDWNLVQAVNTIIDARLAHHCDDRACGCLGEGLFLPKELPKELPQQSESDVSESSEDESDHDSSDDYDPSAEKAKPSPKSRAKQSKSSVTSAKKKSKSRRNAARGKKKKSNARTSRAKSKSSRQARDTPTSVQPTRTSARTTRSSAKASNSSYDTDSDSDTPLKLPLGPTNKKKASRKSASTPAATKQPSAGKKRSHAESTSGGINSSLSVFVNCKGKIVTVTINRNSNITYWCNSAIKFLCVKYVHSTKSQMPVRRKV